VAPGVALFAGVAFKYLDSIFCGGEFLVWLTDVGLRRALSAQIGRLLRRRQRLFAPPEFGQPDGEIVHRGGQIGRERLGPRPRQIAIKIGRLLRPTVEELKDLLPNPPRMADFAHWSTACGVGFEASRVTGLRARARGRHGSR
jgi:hypothetical protein